MRVSIAAILSLLLIASSVRAQEVAHVAFGRHNLPLATPPAAYGSYARGCIAGAVELPEWTENWHAMRLSRNRNWGHPAMIEFIERLSESALEVGWPGIYVGDIGQPRGGPMRSGHRSHQTGLDVDIWMRRPDDKRLSRAERERIGSYNVVAKDGVNLNSNWSPSHHLLLRAAAQDPAVARIFVNAAIKRGLCQGEREAGRPNAPWLRKIRPWHGHNVHFHVRLACPDGSPECRDQSPPPPGSGCGAELAKWFPQGQKAAEGAITRPSEEAEEGRRGKTRGLTAGAMTRDVSSSGTAPAAGAATGTATGTTTGSTTAAPKKTVMLTDLPPKCRAVVTDNVAALGQIAAYEPVNVQQAPEIPVFFDDRAEAHPGFVGTRYFWRPKLDLVAAAQRGVSLVVEGELPPGLSFGDRGAGNGLVSGTPTTGGSYSFTIVAKKRRVEHGRQTVRMKIVDLERPADPAQPPPPPPAGANTASLNHQVRDFVTEFAGEECFFAVPATISPERINIEAFADDAAPIYDFDAVFKSTIGIEANIGGRLITTAQCPALAFARTFPRGTPAPILMDDPDRVIAENQVFEVAVERTAVRNLSLLMISPEGEVTDLSSYLTPRGNTLSVSLVATGAGPRVLVAVDSSAPLSAADLKRAESENDIFVSVDIDGGARASDPRASLAIFVVQ